ncbi:hypothetical protein J7T55_012119 [Diaporthe amygdali]|uniref:uncharacterized protein n=1 Tax=Phomopsis amygdali TaxID=1214568 RepID=UPI0022FED8DC|nr:uncharacterized protein J7T55_012119 [Diaporthe amygdali]KAJ0123653.1 hypothetical protein J7T55_012119 [Diaporthe amygdali]
MAPKKTKQAPRQRIDYRTGWSMEDPIVIDDVEEASKGNVFTKSYTAQNSGPGYRPYFSSLAGGAKVANPAQKHANDKVDGENAATNQSHSIHPAQKRNRQSLSEEDEDLDLNHMRPAKRARHEQLTGRVVTEGQTSHSRLKQNLEATLFTLWKDTDRERATAREIEVAKKEAQFQVKKDQALKAELREAQHRSDMAATLKSMQQDYDRQRQASLELQKAEEQEQLEERRKQTQDAEAKKAGHRLALEDHLNMLWEIHDVHVARTRSVGMGQLSEAGMRRVQERRAAKAREAARRA